MTLDVAVFLFGVLVSTLVGSGLLLLLYGYAYVEQAQRENIQLSDRSASCGSFSVKIRRNRGGSP